MQTIGPQSGTAGIPKRYHSSRNRRHGCPQSNTETPDVAPWAITDNLHTISLLVSIMNFPLSLSFRRVERSGPLEDRARKLAERLPRFCDRIAECRMVLEASDGPGRDSPTYAVKIDLAVPGAHIHADSLHVDGSGHRDIYLALRDAFNNAKRQLQGLRRDRSLPTPGR